MPPASDVQGRKAWLRGKWEGRQSGEARKGKDALVKWYGEERAKNVKYAELFEVCEYGKQPSDAEIRKLFPFFAK